jgi:hypothetical protein
MGFRPLRKSPQLILGCIGWPALSSERVTRCDRATICGERFAAVAYRGSPTPRPPVTAYNSLSFAPHRPSDPARLKIEMTLEQGSHELSLSNNFRYLARFQTTKERLFYLI